MVVSPTNVLYDEVVMLIYNPHIELISKSKNKKTLYPDTRSKNVIKKCIC